MRPEKLIIENTSDHDALLAKVLAWRDGTARAILTEDRTTGDAGHDRAIGLIREIVREGLLPVYGSGNIHRLEDVKKLLYAGCVAVVLQEEEKDVLEEAQARFGADRVLTEEPDLDPVSSIAWEDFLPDEKGLIPCIVQDDENGEVLMLAYMNRDAFALTLKTGRMTYWSRSRQEIWVKGLTSGHYQFVRSLALDCDGDTLLAKVAQVGAACHTGNRSCFYRELYRVGHPAADPQRVLQDVYGVIADRKVHPREGSYTNYLFDKGIDKILKKVGEEASETIIAAKNPDRTESIYEIADLLYHLMVLMCEKGLTWEDIAGELADRE